MPKTRARRRESLSFRFMPDASKSPAIARPALLERFLRAQERGVFLFHAPAGFGKTYALGEWARRARRRGCAVAWINLKPPERDVGALLRGIADALRLARLTTTPHIMPAKGPDRAVRAQALGEKLLSCIGSQSRSVFLILDDYHQAESEEVDAFLQMTFEQMPRNLTIALASRGPTRLFTARLLLEGRFERVDKTALAFSPAETRAFFGNRLSASELKTVHELTAGWPAALRMAEICLPAWRASKVDLDNLTIFLDMFTEYALGGVLSGLSERLVDFLTATSIVEVIEPALADAIANGSDGVNLLDALASSHGILQATDTSEAAWNMPALLRLALRRRLERRGVERARALNSRAAEWYEGEGRLLDAMRHYVAAGKPEVAAAALERAGPITIALTEGDSRSAAMLGLIPREQLAARPRLALGQLFLDYKRGFLAEARHAYEEISGRTARFTADREGGDNQKLAIEAAFIDLTMEVYQRSSVSSSYLQSMEQRFASVAQADVRLALVVQLVLAMFFELRGDLELAANAFLEVEKLNAKVSSPWEQIWLRHHFGALALARGQLHEAQYQLQTGLKVWRSDFRHESSYRALTSILLAEIDYEFDALSEARAKIDEALYSVEHVEGWYARYASVYQTACMLAFHENGPERAELLLDRAEAIQKIRELLKNFLPAMRMRIALLSGDVARAREIADKHRMAEIWAGPASHDELSWREWDLIGALLCRIAAQTDDMRQAIAILDHMHRAVRLSGRLRSQAHVLLLRADVCRRQVEHRSATQYFLQALEIGAAQGYFRIFLDEPESLRALLPLLDTTSGEAAPNHVTAFAARLNRALPGERAPPKESGPLSARERQVMHELSLGHSNKLIARKLGSTEPTVKFHVQNIFRKLNVRRRASAVAEAYRRGFLT